MFAYHFSKLLGLQKLPETQNIKPGCQLQLVQEFLWSELRGAQAGPGHGSWVLALGLHLCVRVCITCNILT